MNGARKILLLASNFPPIRGGSASVYAALASEQPDNVRILAPLIDYNSGLQLLGWREHDRSVSYKVRRIPLLRTTLVDQSELPRTVFWRLWDVKIRLRVIYEVARSVALDHVRAVCIGELVASGWLVKLLRWIPGVRTVAYVHGEEITTHCRGQQSRKRIVSQLQSCDAVIAVSNFTLTEISKIVDSQTMSKLRLISNGVDTHRFRPGLRSSNFVQRYNLEDCFVFVSISRLVEKKGQDNTILALAKVLQKFPSARLLVVGTGPNQPNLEHIAKKICISDRVVFAGQVSEQDLVSHYLLGDVFIMPNRELEDGDTEGFGLVFLEANSCGLPVIAGKDGGSVEAVTHGYNGLVVDGRSIESIAEAMLLLCEDATLRKTLSENGLRRARESDWYERSKLFLEACLGKEKRHI